MPGSARRCRSGWLLSPRAELTTMEGVTWRVSQGDGLIAIENLEAGGVDGHYWLFKITSMPQSGGTWLILAAANDSYQSLVCKPARWRFKRNQLSDKASVNPLWTASSSEPIAKGLIKIAAGLKGRNAALASSFLTAVAIIRGAPGKMPDSWSV